MATCVWMPHWQFASPQVESKLCRSHVRLHGIHHYPQSSVGFRKLNRFKVVCRNSNGQDSNNQSGRTGIQLYSEIERYALQVLLNFDSAQPYHHNFPSSHLYSLLCKDANCGLEKEREQWGSFLERQRKESKIYIQLE